MAKPRFIVLFLTISLAWVEATWSIAAADGQQSVGAVERPPISRLRKFAISLEP